VVVDTDAAVALDRDLVTVEDDGEAVDALDLVLDHHEEDDPVLEADPDLIRAIVATDLATTTVVQNHALARGRHQNLVLDPARGRDDLSDTKFDGTLPQKFFLEENYPHATLLPSF